MSDVLDKWSLLDVALRADRLNTALSTGMFDKWAIDDPALFQSRFEMLKGPSGLGPWSILDDELSQMLMNAALSGGPSPPPYVASAVNFDGSTYVGLTNQALGLAADSPTGLLTFWVNGADVFNSAAIGQSSIMFDQNNSNVNVWTSTATPNVSAIGVLENAANTDSFQCSLNSPFSTSSWVMFATSWDMNHAIGSRKFQPYYGDSPVGFTIPGGGEAGGAFSVNYSDTQWSLASATTLPYSSASGTGIIGDMADFQFWAGIPFLDLTVTANRRLFIDGSGKPVKPSVATDALGQQTVLLSGDATTFANNQGSAPATSVLTGTLTNASTSPSD